MVFRSYKFGKIFIGYNCLDEIILIGQVFLLQTQSFLKLHICPQNGVQFLSFLFVDFFNKRPIM